MGGTSGHQQPIKVQVAVSLDPLGLLPHPGGQEESRPSQGRGHRKLGLRREPRFCCAPILIPSSEQAHSVPLGAFSLFRSGATVQVGRPHPWTPEVRPGQLEHGRVHGFARLSA